MRQLLDLGFQRKEEVQPERTRINRVECCCCGGKNEIQNGASPCAASTSTRPSRALVRGVGSSRRSLSFAAWPSRAERTTKNMGPRGTALDGLLRPSRASFPCPYHSQGRLPQNFAPDCCSGGGFHSHLSLARPWHVGCLMEKTLLTTDVQPQ